MYLIYLLCKVFIYKERKLTRWHNCSEYVNMTFGDRDQNLHPLKTFVGELSTFIW